MPTLGTQTISSSFAQLLKTFTTGGLDGALQVITDGDNTSSALSLSTTGVSSTGSFSVDGASILTGAVTFGSNITASTGTATIGTLSVGTQSVGTSTISTATISTATISTATISTATISTATISTATIPLQLGNITFGSNITASTGTATFGTEIVSTSTIGTLNVSGIATVGSLEIGGTAGPLITKVSYGTAAFTSATVQAHNVADTTTGTFGLTGCALGDIVFGSINTLGAATGTICLAVSFYPQTTDVARYSIINKGATAGTISAGTIFATAMRFTA
jgi:hypothetical protein